MQVDMGEALGRYLDLAANQMKVTAGNIANVDTPGYRAQGFDFDGAFRGALSHLQAGGTVAAPAVSDVQGLVARPDGNTVSLDREGMQLAKAQLQFRTAVELLKHEYSRVLSAIHAEAR